MILKSRNPIDSSPLGAPFLFLPAAGYRLGSNGTLGNRGALGYYWSSGEDTATGGAYEMDIHNTSIAMHLTFDRSTAYSIRCIAE
ncbi:hypothetical protein ATB96_09845 [Elizabethkingia ursingii]|nr:hypothetical protein ATB96_09845 [Elizabethkingia ursingii]